MIKGVIFDWAGTTVDYGCMAPVEAFKETFSEWGMSLSNEEIRKPMGLLKLDHIRSLLELSRVQQLWEQQYDRMPTEEDAQKLYVHFEKQLLEGLANYSTVKPETIETVDWLKSRGIKIGSTTGYTRLMMTIVEAAAKRQGYSPDAVVTPDEVNNLGRPYPFMIVENMKQLELPSVNEVLKVGDTLVDIEEGRHAGVRTVGLIEGSSLMGLAQNEFEQLDELEKKTRISVVREQYKTAGADFILERLGQLPELISSLP